MEAPIPVAQAKPARSTRNALAVALLIAGLAIGTGLGYVIAPKSQPAPSAENTILISGSQVHLSVLAGPMADMPAFVVGGLENPTLQVQPGTQIMVHFLSIDTDLYHSLVFVSQAPPYSASFTAQPAFSGAQTTNPIAGLPPGGNATFSFTASTAGTYWYVCGMPGHASSGMYGKFLVQS